MMMTMMMTMMIMMMMRRMILMVLMMMHDDDDRVDPFSNIKTKHATARTVGTQWHRHPQFVVCTWLGGRGDQEDKPIDDLVIKFPSDACYTDSRRFPH